MPKIPTYNQGGQAPLATGRLGPRLAGAGLESGMLAGVKLTQQALGAVSDIATTFEKRRQDELQNDFVTKSETALREELALLHAQNNPQTVEEWNSLYEETVTKFKNNLDTPSISKTRLNSALRKLDGVGQAYKLDGMKKTFATENTNKVVNWAKALDQTTNEYVSGFVDMDLAVAQHAEYYEAARRSGLEGNLPTAEEFAFNLENQLMTSISNDPDVTYQELQQKIAEVESGQNADGTENRYANYLPTEKDRLINILESRTNKMATEETYESMARSDDAMASMGMAQTDEDYIAAKDAAMAEVETLRSLSQPAKANLLLSKIRALDSAQFLYTPSVAFSSAESRADLVTQKREELLANINTENAAETAAALEALNKTEATVNKLIAEDPAKFVANVFQRANGRAPTASETVQKQIDMGLSGTQIAPFTNEAFTSLIEGTAELDAQTTYKEFSRFFAGFRGQAENFATGRAMRLGMTPAMNIALSRNGDPDSMELLTAEKQDMKEITAGLDVFNVKKGDVARAVYERTAEFKRSIIGDIDEGRIGLTATPARIASVNGFEQAVLKLALAKASRGMDIEEAADSAAKVITSQYNFRRSGSATMRVPAEYDEVTADGFLRQLDAKLRDPAFTASIVFPGSDLEREAFIQDLRDGKGGFVTNDTDDGVYLVDEFENPVFLSANKLGEPVDTRAEFSFDELMKESISIRKQKQVTAKSATDMFAEAKRLRGQIVTGLGLNTIRREQGEEAYQEQLKENKRIAEREAQLTDQANAMLHEMNRD